MKTFLQKYWSQHLYYRLLSYDCFQTADIYILVATSRSGGRGGWGEEGVGPITLALIIVIVVNHTYQYGLDLSVTFHLCLKQPSM